MKMSKNKAKRKKGKLKLALMADIMMSRARHKDNLIRVSKDLKLACDNSFTTPFRFILVAYDKGVWPL